MTKEFKRRVHIPQLAGFALFKKYKSQFRKILDNIYDNFLNALKAREDSKLNLVIAEIQYYIEDKKFLEEPEGRTLQAPPLSSTLVPEADYQEYGRYHQYQEYGYQYHWQVNYVVYLLPRLREFSKKALAHRCIIVYSIFNINW